jgi:hypothetical protein
MGTPDQHSSPGMPIAAQSRPRRRLTSSQTAAPTSCQRRGPGSDPGTSSKVRLDTVTQPRSSTPDGLVVKLSRAKVLPGASAEADRWMAMLNDRADECIATLDRERMAIEIIFRLKENGEDYLFWVEVHGADGAGLDSPIDRDHFEQAKRTKEPGWTEAEPQLLLLPEPVRQAVFSWALRSDPGMAR